MQPYKKMNPGRSVTSRVCGQGPIGFIHTHGVLLCETHTPTHTTQAHPTHACPQRDATRVPTVYLSLTTRPLRPHQTHERRTIT